MSFNLYSNQLYLYTPCHLYFHPAFITSRIVFILIIIIIIVIIIIRYLINQFSQLRRSENDQSRNSQFVGFIVLQLRCNQNDILDYLSSTVQLCKFPSRWQEIFKKPFGPFLIYIKDGVSQDRNFLRLRCHLCISDEDYNVCRKLSF